MQKNLSLPLLIVLMMFPQIVETIYSPALVHIATAFKVTDSTAGQTLSVYFISFAFGVVFWGYLCDKIGRRPSMLMALALYAISTIIAIHSQTFSTLMLARIIMAFTAAIGSIGTQTIMRDKLSGTELQQVFAIMGIALALSPALGMILGSLLVHISGYQAVFWALFGLAILLLSWATYSLPETKPTNQPPKAFWSVYKQMMKDSDIWHTVIAISMFNLSLFTFYQLGPFLFQQISTNPKIFGYSGILLAIGSLLGAYANRYCLKKQLLSSKQLIMLSSWLLLISSMLIWLLQTSTALLIPLIGITLAYSIAIPNILSRALRNYQQATGTAGAILGLFYYLAIGLGLTIIASNQNLGLCLTIIASINIFFMATRTRH